jgi:hypothetical protein
MPSLDIARKLMWHVFVARRNVRVVFDDLRTRFSACSILAANGCPPASAAHFPLIHYDFATLDARDAGLGRLVRGRGP